MKLEDALILRNLDPAKENLETEDTEPEEDHLLFTAEIMFLLLEL